MRLRLTLFAVALASTVVAAQRSTPPPATPARTTNKQLIVEFFAYQGARQDRADRFQAEDYVQHNPRFLRMDDFTGARGRAAWVAAGVEAGKRGLRLVDVPIPLRNPIILMEEGDLAHAVYRGLRPDPTDPSKTYEAFAFESFRIRNGQFTEHWDQVVLSKGWMQPAPPAAPAAGAPAGGAPAPAAPPAAAPPAAVVPMPTDGCGASPEQIATNKTVVTRFLDGVPTTPAAITARSLLLATDYIPHSPRLAAFNANNRVSGRQGWVQAVQAGVLRPAPGPARTRDLLIAQCDFVSVVWKQVLPDPDDASRTFEAFTFDTFRLQNGQLAEHWDGTTR